MYFSLIRLLGVLTTLVFASCFSYRQFLTVFAVLLLGHYATAFIYSLRRLKIKLQSPYGALQALVGVAATLFAVKYRSPPIILLFCIHFVFTEIYYHRPLGWRQRLPSSLTVGRGISCAFFYFIILQFEPLHADVEPVFSGGHIFTIIPMDFAVAGFLCGLLYSIFTIFKEAIQPRRALLDLLLFELVALVIVLLCFFIPQFDVKFDHVIFYHAVVWLLLPLKKIFSEENNTPMLTRYLVLTFVPLLLLSLLIPEFDLPTSLPLTTLLDKVVIYGYFHIIFSFFLSELNPRLGLREIKRA